MFFNYVFRYGLMVPKKRFDGVLKTTNVFGDSDSDNDAKQKPIQVGINML